MSAQKFAGHLAGGGAVRRTSGELVRRTCHGVSRPQSPGELLARHDAAEDLAGYLARRIRPANSTTPSDAIRRNLLSPLKGVRSPARCGGSAQKHNNLPCLSRLTRAKEAHR